MSADHSRLIPRRSPGLLSQEVGDEFVVVDPKTNQAHALSGTLADVWRASESGHLAGPTNDDVEHAINELLEQGLLSDTTGLSRRRLLQGIGGAVAIGGLASIALPIREAAASPIVIFDTVGTFCVSIPAGATANYTIVGAGGGAGAGAGVGGSGVGGSGGRAGSVTGTITNTGGSPASLTVIIGGGGGGGVLPTASAGGVGGTPGASVGGLAGGTGGAGGVGNGNGGGGGGGGGGAESSVKSGATFLVVAAGGGGGGGASGSSSGVAPAAATNGTAGTTTASNAAGVNGNAGAGAGSGNHQGGGGGGGTGAGCPQGAAGVAAARDTGGNPGGGGKDGATNGIGLTVTATQGTVTAGPTNPGQAGTCPNSTSAGGAGGIGYATFNGPGVVTC